MSRAFLDGSFGGMSIDMDAQPSLEEIAARAKTEDPKLYREMVRRGWLTPASAPPLAPHAPTSARSSTMDGDSGIDGSVGETGTEGSGAGDGTSQNTGGQSDSSESNGSTTQPPAPDQGEGSETGTTDDDAAGRSAAGRDSIADL